MIRNVSWWLPWWTIFVLGSCGLGYRIGLNHEPPPAIEIQMQDCDPQTEEPALYPHETIFLG